MGINPRSPRSRGVPNPPLPSPNRPCAPPASSLDLVEKQGLADVAPAAGPSSSREQGRKQAHEKQGAAGGPGADEEHHEQAGGHPQQAGVPGEEVEGGAEGRQRKKSARDSPKSHHHLRSRPKSRAWSQAFPLLLLPPFLWGHRQLLLSPEVGGRGPLQAQAGQVHSSVGHQVEDGDHGSQRVQLSGQEHQLDEDQKAGRSFPPPSKASTSCLLGYVCRRACPTTPRSVTGGAEGEGSSRRQAYLHEAPGIQHSPPGVPPSGYHLGRRQDHSCANRKTGGRKVSLGRAGDRDRRGKVQPGRGNPPKRSSWARA